MKEDIKQGLLNLQREKLDQLKAAVRSVRVDEIVLHMQDINDALLRTLQNEEEGLYKLKLIEAIRKNYEFLVKVADVPFNLPVLQEDKVTPTVQTISFLDDGNTININ